MLWTRFPLRLAQYFGALSFSSTLTSPSVPAAEKQPHSMRLLPAHFTSGMLLCRLAETKSCDHILILPLLIESTGYIWVQMWMNWAEAQRYCRQHYTDLPTIRNSEEQNQLKSIVSSSAWVWIGLFRDSWEWSDKWSNFFRYWAAGQPSQSSGSGDCVGMSTTSSGTWIHESCVLQRPFICHGCEDFFKQMR
uniref:C-type lectin domain-containing protein n=1 Tax=Sinocyclocheilus anshuiensis TaxID=1608454 RepID=A0A671L838_9TELE